MTKNIFGARARSANGSAHTAAAIIPDDANDLQGGVARAIYVGVGGAVMIQDPSGAITRIISASTQYHPLMVSRVLATGTTASDLIALY